MMDWFKILGDLRAEKERVDKAIAALEEMVVESRGGVPLKRRGRKGMSPEERLEVSARMTKYWATRRKRLKQP